MPMFKEHIYYRYCSLKSPFSKARIDAFFSPSWSPSSLFSKALTLAAPGAPDPYMQAFGGQLPRMDFLGFQETGVPILVGIGGVAWGFLGFRDCGNTYTCT